MSGRITEASRRRMEERDQFVHLTPSSYTDVVAPDGLPVIEIGLKGRAESQELADALLVAIANVAHERGLTIREAATA